jgi:hypothetical protein
MVHNTAQLEPVKIQLNPVHICISCFFNPLILFFYPRIAIASGLFFFRFSEYNVASICRFPMSVYYMSCPSHTPVTEREWQYHKCSCVQEVFKTINGFDLSGGIYRLNVQYLRILYVMQSRTTVVHSYLKTSVFISYLFFLHFFVPCFLSFSLHHIFCFIPSFLDVTVLSYSVFTKTVYNQTSNRIFVGLCTAYIAVALHCHTKRLKQDQHKRL